MLGYFSVAGFDIILLPLGAFISPNTSGGIVAAETGAAEFQGLVVVLMCDVGLCRGV